MGSATVSEFQLELQIRSAQGGEIAGYRGLLKWTTESGDDSPSSWVALGVAPLATLLSPDAPAADAEYAGLLHEAVFPAGALREYWTRVRSRLDQSSDARVHFRVTLEESAQALHALRWELLRDPMVQEIPLAGNRQIYFSRYPHLHDGARPCGQPEPQPLRALVVVASPADAGLAPIAIADEMKAVADTLGQGAAASGAPFSVTFLGGAATAGAAPGLVKGRATLARIQAELDTGYTLLYLVCHGQLRDGAQGREPYLVLEKEDGSYDFVNGRALAQFIRQSKAPRLVVMASCQSAETPLGGRGETLVALAPWLAWAGVAAVVGMQGDVKMSTVRKLMPSLFAGLRLHGSIDRALCEARMALDPAATRDWWMPVLFSRIESGMVFPIAAAADSAGGGLGSAVDRLAAELRRPAVREKLLKYKDRFEATRHVIERLQLYKECHDHLQEMERGFEPLKNEKDGFSEARKALEVAEAGRAADQRDRITKARDAWESLGAARDEMAASLDAFYRTASSLLALIEEPAARLDLEQEVKRAGKVQATLLAMPEPDQLRPAELIDVVFWEAPKLLRKGLKLTDEELTRLAALLHLDEIVAALETVTAQLGERLPKEGPVADLAAQVEQLRKLRDDLARMVSDHGLWQRIDTELRKLDPRAEPDDFRSDWDDLQPKLEAVLAHGDAGSAKRIRELGARVIEALGQKGPLPTRLERYRKSVTSRFEEVDKGLLVLCKEQLVPVRSDLDRLLWVIDAGT